MNYSYTFFLLGDLKQYPYGHVKDHGTWDKVYVKLQFVPMLLYFTRTWEEIMKSDDIIDMPWK